LRSAGRDKLADRCARLELRGKVGMVLLKSWEKTLYRIMRAAFHPERAIEQGPEAQKRFQQYFIEFKALPVVWLDVPPDDAAEWSATIARKDAADAAKRAAQRSK
jgi:hypothetical protein